MIGFLFIYWIWKAFSDLAIKYDKNKWKYFFLGIGSYYGGSIIGAFFIAIIWGIIYGFDSVASENFENAGWTFLYVILGGLSCYGAHKILENKLKKEWELNEIEGIESIGMIEEN